VFKNIHGHEPSPPLPDDHPSIGHVATPGRPHRRQHPEWVQRLGHDGIDVKQCQAPFYKAKATTPERCINAATCVMVENKPRPNGLIAALAICDMHKTALLKNHGPDYAHITPLE
jgi:hypothetical protein